tara:strand:+ start:6221 stop:6700 length:480 start_codon:yes stop_codon:yes gene_type:complete
MLVGKLLERAFAKLTIRTSESALTDSEKSDAIDELNNMMRELEADGINIGWTPVSATTDSITTPDWSWRMIYLRLAILIAPEYGKEASATVREDHKSAYETVLSQILDHITTNAPPDLPTGAGNREWGSQRNFVGNSSDEDILTGNGGSLLDQTSQNLT